MGRYTGRGNILASIPRNIKKPWIMTYEQRVQLMSEQMAKCQFTDYKERHLEQQIRYVNYFKDAAKIAVASQAEAIREVHNVYYPDSLSNADEYLIDNGYVPIPEVTSTPNVERPSNAVPVSPDKEDAYAKEVRRIAGMLHTSLEYAFDRQLKPREIQDLMVEAARSMVAERATELIIYAYGSVADYHSIKETDVDEINTREFDQYLLGRGLVPSI